MGKWKGHRNNCWALYLLPHLIFKTAQWGWEKVFWFYRRENRAEATWSEVKSPSHVRLFVTPWTIAYQAAPSMGFPRQEYWSGLPLSSPILAYSEPFFFFMKSQYAWLPVQMTTAERRVKLGVIRQHFSNLSDQHPFHNNKKNCSTFFTNLKWNWYVTYCTNIQKRTI